MLLCENHIAAVLDIKFMNGSSDRFLTCSEDGTVRLWDANDYTVIARCTIMSTGNVFPICGIFTDEVIISGWSDGKIRVFLPQSGKLLYVINDAHNHGCTSVTITSDGERIISGGAEG